MAPMAALVGISRIYNGVHYPSDVLAGAILGAGYASAAVWALETLWRWAGRKWFPLWWREMPSVVWPVSNREKTGEEESEELLEAGDELQPFPPQPPPRGRDGGTGRGPLPQGEEAHSPARGELRVARSTIQPGNAFPLRGGEGKGEGE